MAETDKLQKKIKNKIAVGSGKGGVGKSTISLNLSIYYAGKSKKTLFIDIDPLSDVKTIIDREDLEGSEIKPVQIFENLFLLTPFQSAEKVTSRLVYEKLKNNSYFTSKDNFDIIIFDLPAGLDEQENIAFLDFADILIVVTNPEPAAHVAAGSYIKKVSERNNNLPIFIWHNRYEKSLNPNFNQDDVFLNYNKNVPKEERFKPSMAGKFLNIARIPKDSSLDLLGTNTTFPAVALRNIITLLELIYREKTMPIANSEMQGKKIASLVNSYISMPGNIEKPELSSDDLIDYLSAFMSRLIRKTGRSIDISSFLSDNEKSKINNILQRIKTDKMLIQLRKTLLVTDDALQSIENSSRMFYVNLGADKFKAVQREIGISLSYIEKTNPTDEVKHFAGVILFYFAVFNIIQNKKYNSVIINFIPKKKNKKGEVIRDRYFQIKQIIEKNSQYRGKFLALVKFLHTPLMAEIENLTKKLLLNKIILSITQSGSRKANSGAYAKLLGNYLHDSINSGLSVVIGFPYRTASVNFHKAAELVLGLLND
jgi:flagellar biosynthesis protein FlhG